MALTQLTTMLCTKCVAARRATLQVSKHVQASSRVDWPNTLRHFSSFRGIMAAVPTPYSKRASLIRIQHPKFTPTALEASAITLIVLGTNKESGWTRVVSYSISCSSSISSSFSRARRKRRQPICQTMKTRRRIRSLAIRLRPMMTRMSRKRWTKMKMRKMMNTMQKVRCP